MRERAKDGRAVLRIDVDLFGLADVLVKHGLLEEWDADDREKIERATEKMIAALVLSSDA